MPEEKLIPDKGRDFVCQWAEKIKPLLSKGGKLMHCTNDTDHFEASFPWGAKATSEAKDLMEVARIRTLHTYGYYGFFKPSLAEVIQQIPEEVLGQVEYFVINGPDTADDLNREKEMLNKGYHVAETVLYKKTPKPEKVKKAPAKRKKKEES